jgi:hypothetical protein
MERYQIHLTRPQLIALKKVAKASGTKVAELIRRAIDDYLVTRYARVRSTDFTGNPGPFSHSEVVPRTK